jgi:transcriptional/translational regulatory protein YebC/TACO1
MELPIKDFEVEENTAVIYTDKLNFIDVQKKLEELHYHIIEADIQFEPDNMVTLS